MNTINEIKAKLSNEFEKINPNNLNRMKELLLIANLHHLDGNVTNPNDVFLLIKHLQGKQEFLEWSPILQAIKKYTTLHEYRKPERNKENNDPWLYCRTMIENISLKMVKLEYPEERLAQLFEKKCGAVVANTFLSYCLWFDYNLIHPNTKNTIRTILQSILAENNKLHLFYSAYEIYSRKNWYIGLKDLEQEMIPFFGTAARFKKAFKEINGVEYKANLAEAKKVFDKK